MLWLKGCPKCKRGDLAHHQDIYGNYLECIQCGYTVDMPKAGYSLAAVTAQVRMRYDVPAERWRSGS